MAALVTAALTLGGCGIFLFGKYQPPALDTEKTTHVTFQNDYGVTAHVLVAEKSGECLPANKRLGWQLNGMLPYREATPFDVARGEPVNITIYDQGNNGGRYWQCFVNNVYTFDRSEVTLRFVRVPGGCKVEVSDAAGEPILNIRAVVIKPSMTIRQEV
ncbi:hypothetical protein [Ralstonia syzygii]|uniref:hypothetical protein n=1 Tax=Ralstonia syzygii TaxID=28097 RepID=UPI0018D11796